MQTKDKTYRVLEDVLQHSRLLISLDEVIRKNPEMTVGKFWQDFQKETGKEGKFSTINAGTLLILLYGMIVFPWERLRKKIRRDPLLKETHLNEWCNFKIFNLTPSMQRKPLPLYFVLGLMRNAISHGNVRISDDLRITFKDKKGTSLAFSYDELNRFLERLMQFYG